MDALFSKTLKAGDRTYFVDVREAKNKSKYLTITETHPPKEGEKRETESKDGDKKFARSSVMVFESQIEPFRDALTEAIGLIQKK